MMRILTFTLFVIASSCFAANPPSPLDPGKEWSGPIYEKIPKDERNNEYWNYRIAGVANLIINKQLCSICKPLGSDVPNGIASAIPTDVTAVVAAGEYRGMLTLSIEPEHHIAFRYVTGSSKHTYAIDLIMLEGIPARESMRLQQEVLRMVSGWKPE